MIWSAKHPLVSVRCKSLSLRSLLVLTCCPVLAHNTERDVVPSYHVLRKVESADLGIVALTLSAQSLLVCGRLHLEVDIPAVQCEVQIEDVRIDLLQAWELQSLRDSELKEDIPPVAYTLWSLKDKEKVPIPISKDGGFYLDRHFVQPENNAIRSSSSPHSETGLKASHQLSVHIIYSCTSDSKSAKKEVKIRSRATLAMCACVIDALQLPGYHTSLEEQMSRQRACDGRALTCWWK